MATATIKLPDELDARLRRRAADIGEDYEAYLSDLLARTFDEIEIAASIKRGLADVEAGRTRPAKQAIYDLAQELGLPLSKPQR